MIKTQLVFSLFLIGLISLKFSVIQTQAAPVAFTIDNTQSQVTISGNLAGFTITPQASGSLQTVCNGSINADLTASTIQFTGSSSINAQTNGVWKPAIGGGSGSAAADYGAQASVPFVGTAFGALRNIVLDLTSPALTLVNTNFDSSSLVFSFPPSSTATIDYNAGFVGQGSKTLAGYSTNTLVNAASLTTNGAVKKLLIQINTTFTFSLISSNDTMITLTGQIIATNSLSAAPAPLINSIVITNQNVVLTVQNATAQSLLQNSTNLTGWLPASPVVTTNNSGQTFFTVPMVGNKNFFRVQQ